jgi:hypothetical protein
MSARCTGNHSGPEDVASCPGLLAAARWSVALSVQDCRHSTPSDISVSTEWWLCTKSDIHKSIPDRECCPTFSDSSTRLVQCDQTRRSFVSLAMRRVYEAENKRLSPTEYNFQAKSPLSPGSLVFFFSHLSSLSQFAFISKLTTLASSVRNPTPF